MDGFPRTEVGGVSLPRMIIGTNWFLGWSHCTKAKDNHIKSLHGDYKSIADIIEVFFNAGVNAIVGQIAMEQLRNAIDEAEQRTGVKAIVISTPGFKVGPSTPIDGLDMDEVQQRLDEEAAHGATFCMPHQSTTDPLVDRCTREIRKMDTLCAAIRERGMIPGLSTHMPEAIVYADQTKLDVETYISIYNSMGFLMPVEVDWVQKIILNAKKPVLTIKPMAAGQLRPLQALSFVWNTIREQDMVCVGTLTPQEAAELIELSLSMLEKRTANIELQETRSKASVKE